MKNRDAGANQPEGAAPAVSAGCEIPKMRRVKSIPLPCRSRRVFSLYEVREEKTDMLDKDGAAIWMKSAYSPSGYYIGSPKYAHHLCVKRGIAPEPRTPDGRVCCIGWSSTKHKWFGWSHRAIYGFKVGSKVMKGDCGYLPKSRGGRGEWRATTLFEAKQMACDFAESVS